MFNRIVRRTLWVVGIGGLVGFGLLNVLAYNHAYAMTHFFDGGVRTDKPEQLSASEKLNVLLRGVRMVRPADAHVAAELDPACTNLVIAEEGGVSLAAWYADRGPSAPLVIVFHGYGSEKSQMLPEARALLGLGLSVLLVDFRGSGGSSGDYTTIGVREADDVAAAVSTAKACLPHAKLVLYGQSMGAAAILRAVHERQVAPDAVILEAAFDSLLATVRNRFAAMHVPAFPSAELLVFWGGWQYGFNGFAHNPAEYATSLKCPALFLHGRGDRRVSVAESRRIFDAAPEPKAYKEFEDVGHQSCFQRCPEAWTSELADFLKGAGVLRP